MMKKVELLAPAGDQESLIAAVQNGADAIYLGGTLFNARAFAKNFDNEQLKWAVEYAHLRNVKIYVTVNTLYKDEEFEGLIEYLDYLYAIQVDALIIQDIGLFDVVRKRYDDFEIHMSTQESIMNSQAVQYFEQQGASRIVLARENTLEEIQNICASTHLEVEVFVHGALCVCYSGQCLMSSFIGKRSGNRGECAQPCRLQYRLSRDNHMLDNQVPYILSPKDLMTIDNIGDLIDAGVTSFKVEGRMKKPEYVASVVKAYRRAIDNHLQHQKTSFEDDIIAMKMMFNRDYTKGYIYHDDHIVIGDYSGNKGVIVGEVIGYRKQDKRVIVKLNESLHQGDSIVFESIDKGRPVNKMYCQNQLVNQGNCNEIIEIEFDYPVYAGHVRKTIDTSMMKTLQKTYDKDYKKLPIHMTFEGLIGEYPILTIQYASFRVTKKADIKIEKALKTPFSVQRIQQQLAKLGQSSFCAENISIHIDDDMTLPIKILNELRRESIEELSQKLSHHIIHHSKIHNLQTLTNSSYTSQKQIHVLASQLEQLQIILNYHQDIDIIYYPFQKDSEQAYQECLNHNKTMALFIPRICKDKDLEMIKNSGIYSKVNHVVVNDYGAYHYFSEKKRIIGTGFNVYNSYAHQYYQAPVIVSLEMSQRQIQNMKCIHQNIILQIYGKVETMISEYCPISQYYFGYQKKNCQLCRTAHFSLIDRKKEKFDLMMDENCRMHLLNARTLYIAPNTKMDVGNYFIHLTNEDCEMTKFVMEEMISLLKSNQSCGLKEKVSTTSGYFKG